MEEPNEIPPPPEPKKPTTLSQLLHALTEADNAFVTLSLEEHIDLMEAGRVKVDNYKYLLDKMKSQEEILDKWVDEYTAAKRIVANNRRRLQEHLVYVMKSSGFEMFTGHRFRVKIQKSKPAVQMAIEPNDLLKLKFPEIIRTKYEWDKVKVYELLKSGDEKISELGTLKESLYPSFSIVKDV